MDDARPHASDTTSFSADAGPVPKSRSIDVSRRTRRYLVNMAIRMVCLGLMLLVPGPWKIVMLAGALIIPLLAVLWANDQDLEGNTQRAQSTPRKPRPDAEEQRVEIEDVARESAPTLTLMPDGSYAQLALDAPSSQNRRQQK